MVKEENPFENKKVAKEWIRHVENTKGETRDNEIYPLLKKWATKIKPDTIIEIGSGQGICSEKINLKKKSFYIGIEPSIHLVRRARRLYKKSNRKFIIGSANHIPIKSSSADAVFSVNVWFHLMNLKKASAELSRILKQHGQFLIITANPKAYRKWESFYFNYKKRGKKIVGKVKVPVTSLSLSIFYKHSLKDIKKSLNSNNLSISNIKEIGRIDKKTKLFISVLGKKA